MKKVIYMLSAALMVCSFASCEEAETYDELIPSDTLYLPRDNYPVMLSRGQNVIFEWQTSQEGMLSYQLMIDTETGDFSEPLYIVTSANNGLHNSVEVENSTLRSIIDRIDGIPGEVVNLKWTVRVIKNGTAAVYAESRTLVVTVPDQLPETVIMNGSATENGGEISLCKALPVHQGEGNDNFVNESSKESGCFECFTRLSAGDFTMVDDLGRFYSLKDDGTVSRHIDEEVTSTNNDEGIFWLYINFNSMRWQKKEIAKVEFWHNTWFNGDYLCQIEMDYEENGVWSLVDYPWQCGDQSQFDSRYCFLCTYVDENPDDDVDPVVEKWGYFSDDCRQNGNPDGTPGFYNIYRFNNAGLDSWKDTYKTIEDQRQGLNQLATFRVYMNNENSEDYYHERSFRDK